MHHIRVPQLIPSNCTIHVKIIIICSQHTTWCVCLTILFGEMKPKMTIKVSLLVVECQNWIYQINMLVTQFHLILKRIIQSHLMKDFSWKCYPLGASALLLPNELYYLMFVLEDLAVLTATGHFNNHITNITAGYSLIPCEWMSKFLSTYHIMTQLCSCCQKGTVNHKRKTDLRIRRSVPRRQMCLLRIILSSSLKNSKNR